MVVAKGLRVLTSFLDLGGHAASDRFLDEDPKHGHRTTGESRGWISPAFLHCIFNLGYTIIFFLALSIRASSTSAVVR